MNIADKSTLDTIHALVSRIGTHKGYKNTATSMRYYLPAGTNIICDRGEVEVLQSSGEIALIDEGYQITEDSLVTIIATNTNYIEYVAYNIV